MSGWRNITFTSGHAMYPLVDQVMQCIYRTVNPRCHLPSLSYRENESGYEPSIVILNLREGSQMKTHFMINLNSMNIHDKFEDTRFSIPEEIQSAATQLREYARKVVREGKEAEEARRREEALRLQKAREEHRKRVQASIICSWKPRAEFFPEYRHSIVVLSRKVCLTKMTRRSYPAMGRDCPLCSAQPTSCGSCRIISCSNIDCKASAAVPIVKCHTHPSRNSCTSCLESPMGFLPRLGQCPICTHWFCSEELYWCIGRPLPNESTGGVEPSSSTIGGSGMVTRLHPTRPISCFSTACKTSSKEAQGVGRRCGNTSCWSVLSMSTTVCPDCTTQDSFSCPCSKYWTCGSCESQSSTVAKLITCPRCQQSFCSSCSYYIGHCRLCECVGLCNDCMEEEGEGEDIKHTQVVNIFVKCENCGVLLCETCTDDAESFCAHCEQRMCNGCGDKSEVCKRCVDYEVGNAYDDGFYDDEW
ncbi:hypothetical protein K503DRAFT_774817 [Rhizopogon vinicolor AM-OR11-026]|uniref:Uncharacterized protein n=1 Tax=Rhizopogon vinicolor AM-OR11-026 TaxID=1314800 RepID=A0A1B7MNN4_9AGAM|nr:hypothetical protein K503DRAFT_774817 [Rhizopogon vinicolor AM-OR11-026]